VNDEIDNPSSMHILEIVDVDNMVGELDEKLLTRIGTDVVEEYEVDKASMDEWNDQYPPSQDGSISYLTYLMRE